jgi:uncharacterized protein (DUF1330 family)
MIYQVVVYNEIRDEAALVAYAQLAGPAIQKAGGRFIARGLPVKTLEQGKATRTVVIEWDDLETAIAGFESDDYVAALRELGDAAVRDIRYIPAVS